MKSIKKIVITGGKGRFAETLKKKNKSLNISYPDKRKLNILSTKSIENYFKKIKPKFVLHAAALSRPMDIHDKKISKSIDLNIIGTAILLKFVKNTILNLSIFQQIMFIREKKVIIKNKIQSYRLTIMLGQNLEGNVQ